jgi:hypothetical protein
LVVLSTRSWNSLLRCPIGCLLNACKTFSGTGVGPGIINDSFFSMATFCEIGHS